MFNDTDNNCIRNIEPGLNGKGIIAQPGPFYAVSDALGNYSLNVDTGVYNVKEIYLHTHTFADSVHCPTSYSVTMTSSGQIDTGYDFQNTSAVCPFMDIGDINSSYFADCDTIHIMDVEICNYGRDTARNPVLTIQYPTSIFTPISCSVPYTYNSTSALLTIAFSSLPPDSCFVISVTDSVICSSVPSFTGFTFRFHVTPTNSCVQQDSVFNYDSISTSFVIEENIANTETGNKKLYINPNPTSGRVFISGMGRATRIEIFDLIGSRVFFEEEHFSETETIDLTNLPSGVYLVVVTGESGVIARKIFKM